MNTQRRFLLLCLSLRFYLSAFRCVSFLCVLLRFHGADCVVLFSAIRLLTKRGRGCRAHFAHGCDTEDGPVEECEASLKVQKRSRNARHFTACSPVVSPRPDAGERF